MSSNLKNNNDEIKELLVLAILAGKIMLKNGAETYRVEDTIKRICQSRKNVKFVDSFVTPTGIFVSLEYENEIITYLKRINYISTNLNTISLVNDFSRRFVNTNLSIEEGMRQLDEINNHKIYPPIVKILFGSIASSVFSLIIQGTFNDFISAFIVSFIVLITLEKISKYRLTIFMDNFFGAFLASALACISIEIGFGHNLDKIIIGTIMYLVPGISITNSIRDTISGDYLSGLSRGLESIFSALAIAFGVGIVLNFYFRGVI